MNSYDHYMTVTRPANYNSGWRDGYYGEPSDPESHESEEAYLKGFAQGEYERAVDKAIIASGEEQIGAIS